MDKTTRSVNQHPPKSKSKGGVALATNATASSPPGDDNSQEWTNRRASAQATRAANARQVSGRRRFVDPTTCERDYSESEMEFMQAMHEYKQSSGRMFPTWSEVLEVLKALGYEKPGSEVAGGSLLASMDHPASLEVSKRS
ncbi:MAG: hypothetical protein NVSMB9_23430 [Isosphaeraceae bacterium]